jgi:hypothetical protein
VKLLSLTSAGVGAGGALTAGQAIEIEFDNGDIITGGNVVVTLNTLTVPVTGFSFTGGDSEYRANDVGGFNQSTGVSFTADGLTLKFTILTTTTYRIEVDGVVVHTGTLQGFTGIDEITVTSAGAGNGPTTWDLFFNCVRIYR